jgi:hypothetical protein
LQFALQNKSLLLISASAALKKQEEKKSYLEDIERDWYLILHNDNIHSIEDVVKTLEKVSSMKAFS